jgi:His-Xaa-Ser system radical SAM maturase HxsC
MSRSTRLLGISGGEPTLAPDALLEAILACRSFLPETALHLLSNGRMFSYLSLCEAMAQVRHQDLVVGIPLYSQVPCLHDYIVQAEGAFDETIRGIMNLARFGQAVEIRMVIMKQTAKNLPEWARFVARNLPFASHVALMGMEAIGHGRAHFDDLWVDPASYRTELAVAVEILAGFGINVSIYNHQLCVLDQELWPFARKSISDWKTGYVDECAACSMKEACGGFFSSSSLGRSKHIHRI